MKRFTLWLTAALALVLILPATSFAQGPVGGDGDQLGKRYQEVRARVLREKAGLSEEKAVQVEQILDELQPQRRALREQVREQHRALKELLRSDSEDQDAYRAAMEKLFATQDRLHELKQQEIEALQDKLTPKEQAKVLASLKKMRRHAMRKFREHRMGRGGYGEHRRGRGYGGGGGWGDGGGSADGMGL